jgi:hypothetical protein
VTDVPAKVYPMGNKTRSKGHKNDPIEDESLTLQSIARRHGLSEDALVRFVANTRQNARSRRRRISDSQIIEAVRELGRST